MIRVLVFIFLISSFAYGQNNFPTLSGETLTGESLEVPKALIGKKSILGLAYSKKADDDLRTWFEPAYYKFIDPPKSSLFPVDPFEGNLFFIPMLQGLAKAAGGKVEKELKKGIDPKLHKYILMFRGSVKEIKDELEMKSASSPYFFILDEEGKILYKTDGPYSDEKMEEIESYLE